VVTQITRNISGRDGISIYRRGDAVPRMMKIRIYITASTRSGRDRIVSLANNPGLAGSHPQQLPASPHGPQNPAVPPWKRPPLSRSPARWERCGGIRARERAGSRNCFRYGRDLRM